MKAKQPKKRTRKPAPPPEFADTQTARADGPAPPPPTPPPPNNRMQGRPPPPPPPPPPLLGITADGRALVARYASEVAASDQKWVADGLIPEYCLSLAVGAFNVGKSTFGAWLCRQAKRPAVIGSAEESTAAALVPRLRAAGCDLTRVLLLDGRPWTMPADRLKLTGVLTDSGIDLLWIDPIDGLVGPTESENDGQYVRAMLESLAKVASDARVTIVCARHPGKAPGNVCPGSRQWSTVPRLVLQLLLDPGPPVRRFVRRWKDSYGRVGETHEFTLVGDEGEPPRFSLGPLVADADVSLGEVTDRIDRWRIDQAEALIRGVLGDGEQPSRSVYAAGEGERIGDRLMRRAAERLGVIVRREGTGVGHLSYWSLPPAGTPATPDTTPPHPP